MVWTILCLVDSSCETGVLGLYRNIPPSIKQSVQFYALQLIDVFMSLSCIIENVYKYEYSKGKQYCCRAEEAQRVPGS